MVQVRKVLGWDDAQEAGVLEATSLLFPVREGLFHVFHKTVVDWLTGEITEGSSLTERSAEFRVDRADGHARLAAGFEGWRGDKEGGGEGY